MQQTDTPTNTAIGGCMLLIVLILIVLMFGMFPKDQPLTGKAAYCADNQSEFIQIAVNLHTSYSEVCDTMWRSK